jgi:phosphoribosylformylglycinamidine synthase
VIRQYDHEVQAGSVIKPLVGVTNDGPSDASVVRPVLTSRRGLVISNGMNPCYGDFDTYWMAASAIDEAIRNAVAVGADPRRLAILDNFCWGNTDRPETLGSLVRAALACHDMAIALETPFISGKDSLNNEFRPSKKSGPDSKKSGSPDSSAIGVPKAQEATGSAYTESGSPDSSAIGVPKAQEATGNAYSENEPISIPSSLLISALGQVEDIAQCVTMDLKRPGNLIYLVGLTKNELGGSHYALVENLTGGEVPKVDFAVSRKTFDAIHNAIRKGLLRACHDLSEGGLACAIAEMAFAGGYGAKIDVNKVPCSEEAKDMTVLLFSESNTRFLCEVTPENAVAFESTLQEIPNAKIGEVTATPNLEISSDTDLIQENLTILKETWQKPLRW